MTTQHGKAFLVGAGPGHPGLITVRGLRRLQSAEVVLYDRLIPRDLLSKTSASAELIFVGKRHGHHPKPQAEINRLLVKHVQAGKQVVRLKGGDPFVFSRGGEEVTTLLHHGLDFEVVPGLTSPIAVPAFAGIPVTQKGLNTSFTVTTGYEAPDKPETMIDWAALAQQEVLILLMSVRRIRLICNKLIAHGKASDTPIAVISQGATSQQQVLAGTLATFPDLLDATPLPTPGILVVGSVVEMHNRLGMHPICVLAPGFADAENKWETTGEPSVPTSPPRVAIVGAGPGSADLITVRGLQRLREADVILHDRLVNPDLIAQAPNPSEIINVGKSDSRDRYPQSEVTRLLIKYAQSGRRVVRLKGGDPFVFGLGGDECMALREAGIEYELVPGLSSVTAVPACAGIPLTQRRVNTSFTVLSGHAGAKACRNLPKNSTLVILMGVRKLKGIAAQLLRDGHSPEKPVAIIESGTTAQERVTISTLKDIDKDMADIRSPALIIIGDVVRLRHQPKQPTHEPQLEAVWGTAVR